MAELKDNETNTRWNSLHEIPGFSPKYPNESVIRWTFRNFPRDKAANFNLLDAGAGMGRHAILWAKEGYNVTATDVSPVAVTQIDEWAREDNLTITTKAAEADAQPYADECFDGVLSFGVLLYLPYPRLKVAISEIWRVLKPGGIAYVMVRSTEDSRYNEAELVDRFTYKVAPLKTGAYWSAEVGMDMTFLDRSAIEECFSAFSEIEINRSSITTLNGAFVDDDWLIELKK